MTNQSLTYIIPDMAIKMVQSGFQTLISSTTNSLSTFLSKLTNKSMQLASTKMKNHSRINTNQAGLLTCTLTPATQVMQKIKLKSGLQSTKVKSIKKMIKITRILISTISIEMLTFHSLSTALARLIKFLTMQVREKAVFGPTTSSEEER